MKYILIFVISFLFFACSPQKRLDNMLKRHPYLAVKDTIVKIDSVEIVTPAVQIDSSASIYDLRRDTLIIRENQLTIKTFIRNDTVFVNGECDTIKTTVVREVLVPYNKFTHKPRDKLSWRDYVTASFIAIVVLAFIFLLAFMVFKR